MNKTSYRTYWTSIYNVSKEYILKKRRYIFGKIFYEIMLM